MAFSRLSSDQITTLQRRFSDLINYADSDPTAPIEPMTYQDCCGDCLLHIAALRGDLDAVKWLLDAGIDPNVTGDMDCTPLHYAAMGRHRSVADILIARGAGRTGRRAERVRGRPGDVRLLTFHRQRPVRRVALISSPC